MSCDLVGTVDSRSTLAHSERVRKLPVEAVRDLLGIARAMYAAKKSEGAPAWVLEELRAIGEKLKLALELGRTAPDTLGHRAGITHAEDACARLTRLITHETLLAPTLEAAAVRVRRMQIGPSASEQQRTGRRERH
jgi:hypothetical protein